MTCDVPVPRPIIMGDLRYNTRDYVVVEITTDEGLSGFGWGMARYAPVAEIIERNLKPLLIGEDPLLNERLWDRLYYLNLLIAQRGIYMRALSVVDIALWDLKGKAAGLPVWKLLGGHRRRMPVLMAGGYVAADRDVRALRDEVANYAKRGFRLMKICALAAARGVPVSPHVYPEIHVHLAAALPIVAHVEMTDPPQGIEAMHRLMASTLEIRDGMADAPDRPGLGFEPDRAALKEFRR